MLFKNWSVEKHQVCYYEPLAHWGGFGRRIHAYGKPRSGEQLCPNGRATAVRRGRAKRGLWVCTRET